jgi:hypothetical protein
MSQTKLTTNYLLCVASLLAVAGLTEIASATEAANETPEAPLYRPLTLGLDAGTTGFGGALSWRFADHWGVRAGGDYFKLSNTGVDIDNIHYNATLRLLSEPITFDIYPWKTSSFRFTLGILLNQNELSGDADAIGNITIGGMTFPADTVGILHLHMKQQPVNPYFGIAGNFFYFDHAHHWAFAGELGVAYTGDQDVSLTRTGPPSAPIDAAVARAEAGVQHWADQFKWWPVAKLAVTYSF